MHQNKEKSISACLADRTDYAKKPDKTNDGELLSAYQCDSRTVQGEFMLSKRQYDDITGRNQVSNVIAYQIRQAFKPGEITPELANKIGYELGMSFTKGNHAFIVATHVDKLHTHNHIIFNSTSLDCAKNALPICAPAFSPHSRYPSYELSLAMGYKYPPSQILLLRLVH